MPWIVVTTPLHNKAWLNVDHCSRVRKPLQGEIGHAVIDLAGRPHAGCGGDGGASDHRGDCCRAWLVSSAWRSDDATQLTILTQMTLTVRRPLPSGQRAIDDVVGLSAVLTNRWRRLDH